MWSCVPKRKNTGDWPYWHSHVWVRDPGAYVLCMLARRHNTGYVELQLVLAIGHFALLVFRNLSKQETTFSMEVIDPGQL